MTDYYVQLDGDYMTNGHGSGTVGDPYNGPVLDNLLNNRNGFSVAAGDKIYVRGTLELGNYYALFSVSTTGSVAVDDILGDDVDPGSATFTARVVAIDGSAAYLWVSGNFSVTQLHNYTQTGTLTPSYDMDIGVINYTISGDATGYISVIGCPQNSWTPDGQMAVLDGQSIASYCLSLSGDYIEIANLHMTRATSQLLSSSSGSHNHLIRHCEFSLCGASSFAVYPNYCYYTTIIDCYIHDNAAAGLALNQERVIDTVIANNTGYGAYVGSMSVLHGCVISGNGSYGLSVAHGCMIRGCVIDGNGNHGITTSYSDNVFIDNRITGNGGYGLNGAGGTYSDRNVYAGNASGNFSGSSAGPADIEAADGGYTDAASGDYSTAATADLRRSAITLPDGNINYISAGLAPGDWANGYVLYANQDFTAPRVVAAAEADTANVKLT